jgi:hypothetical protein
MNVRAKIVENEWRQVGRGRPEWAVWESREKQLWWLLLELSVLQQPLHAATIQRWKSCES